MFKTIVIAALLGAGLAAAEDAQFVTVENCNDDDFYNPLGFGTIAWTSGACMEFDGVYLKADCTTGMLTVHNASSCLSSSQMDSITLNNCGAGGFRYKCSSAPEDTVGTLLMYNEGDCSDTPNLRYFVTDECFQTYVDDDDMSSMTVTCENKDIMLNVYTGSGTCSGSFTSLNVPANECMKLSSIFPSDDDCDCADDDDHPFFSNNVVAKCGADLTADGTGSATTASVTAGLIATVAFVAALF
ncbi:uncharacterized protein MONBRDRAFT_33309 [Monosiga brevicollis MX1]|uniref:Uncharacterized protein n=1 Tax=Monosiga brevicollis TaxID=81824 RepID=A9V4N2_MONBE|nr:uncharacterized protein MONBRDRAFT_33309 [Monosiga brevicollis MX1]EDQ87484.1 predicted protein [Monosiga brevicollis MX1]|eukprot:XP_001747744.1 hypothetical protein [Monosiga brevicollis MX1]